jgi:hypothetical protein
MSSDHSGPIDVSGIVDKYSRLTSPRPTIVPSQGGMTRLQNGILFVIAPWSAPAIYTFIARTATLQNLAPLSVPVYVIDSDVIDPAFFAATFGGQQGGWGETFWLNRGTVQHSIWQGGPHDSAHVREYTVALTRSLEEGTDSTPERA